MSDGIDLRNWTTDDRVPPITPEQAHAASLTVCQHGHDVEDRRTLLGMLGLLEDS